MTGQTIRPCEGKGPNVCVAEGCFGQSCLSAESDALHALSVAGLRHLLGKRGVAPDEIEHAVATDCRDSACYWHGSPLA